MKLFVWDFHGVLETGTEQAVLEITNAVLQRAGHSRQLSPEENSQLYGKRWFEYFSFLLPGHPSETHKALQSACFSLQQKEPQRVLLHVRSVPAAAEVLAAIQKAGHDQIVLSNTQPEAMPMFLSAAGVSPFFPTEKVFAINAHENPHPQTKSSVVLSYLRSHPSVTSAVIIGDSPADMAISPPLPAVRYLYAHPNRPFREASADFRIRDLREVLREL